MASLSATRALLEEFPKPGHDAPYVAVFVGGTSGIGEATLKALCKRCEQGKIYIIGRNEKAAASIITYCERLSPSSSFVFLRQDLTNLRDVDRVCEIILQSETSIDLLFMTQGYLSVSGRVETEDGTDKLLSLRYYSRMRIIIDLLPLLKKATSPRVISVFAPGKGEWGLHLDDLGLEKNYGIFLGVSHASFMNTFFMEELSVRHPSISFIHAYPGMVITPEFENADFPPWLKWVLRWVFIPIIRPFCLSLEEVGDRMLFMALSMWFPSRDVYNQEGGKCKVSRGSDGEAGSGAYCLDWTGEPSNNLKILQGLREANARTLIWDHTTEVFGRVGS